MEKRLAERFFRIMLGCSAIAMLCVGSLVYQGEYLLAAAEQGSKTKADYRNLLSEAATWNDEAALKLAMLELDSGETTAALTRLRSTAVGTYDWQGWEREGVILERLNASSADPELSLKGVRSAYSDVLQVYPNYERGLERMGLVALKQSEWDTAKAISRRISAITSEHASGEFIRALAEEGSGNTTASLELFQRISSSGRMSSGTLFTRNLVRSKIEALSPK